MSKRASDETRGQKSSRQGAVKRKSKYSKPRITQEAIFDRSALSCGKSDDSCAPSIVS